jgi:hypothetical protein
MIRVEGKTMSDDGFYLSILMDATNLGKLHRDQRNTIMLRETYAELPSMSGLDYETVQDAYRAYRNAYNVPVTRVTTSV